MGLKRLGQAARVVQRVVHGIEQRQIAQLGTTAHVALRKNVSAHHHCFRLTSGLDPSISWTSCTSG
jgi:glutamyl-tRNA reductase